ncbi:hypothetical protein G3A43_07365 [Paraburkholderia aspalathi]|nr:hypothetical protein [Paraburkholderia aspalathi]MBK3780072.1 hypothetical protein [Paraburkholderia aspalathi]
MAKTVTVTHLGMEGEGATAGQAKKNAEARIEAALTGEWDPYVIVHKGRVAFIVRKPSTTEWQWGFKVVNATEHEPLHNQWVDLNYKDRPETIRAAASSLAQMAGTYEGLKPFLLESQITDLDRYFDWQTAYRLATVAGKSVDEARSEADALLAKRDARSREVAA